MFLCRLSKKIYQHFLVLINLIKITTTMNLNWDYYDLDEINNLAPSILEFLETSLKVFHTNKCSLQGNFDKLDSFLDNLLFSFDVISLSETWNSKSKTYLFDEGNIHGYQKYIGQTGTTLKSGCGTYISNKINFAPRPDLSTHFFNNKNEFETLWIKVINEKKRIF